MICEHLITFIDQYKYVYDEVWKSQNFKHPLGEYLRKNIAEAFRELAILKTSYHVVKASCGTGKWTAVPWIAIFDNRITQSAQKGVYIVYLLNKDTQELYLTLNQAASGSTLSELKSNAQMIQRQLGISHSKKILSGSKAYDAGCIVSKKYTISDLYDEERFLSDLSDFINLYEYYYSLYNQNNLTKTPEKRKSKSKIKISSKITEIIKAYKDDFATRDEEERYKWQAVGTYRKVWNIDASDFADMLKSAFKDTSNLLKSGNYYPYKMICKFAEEEPETVRSLFKTLYDENLPLGDRCSKFQEGFSKHFKPQGLNHYQDLHAISVYLTCEYPEKYYIYKYSVVKEFINQIQYDCDSIDKMTDSEKMELLLALYNEVLEIVKQDEEVLEFSRDRLDDSCYLDEAYHMLTHDIIYFASKHLGIDAKIGTFDSWEIVDEVTAIKTCDKSFFDYNGSGVPKGMCWFFDAEELETSENKSLSLVYNGVTYDAKVQNDSTDRRRVRIFWNAELGKLFNNYKDSSVKARFTKQSDAVYAITIIGGEKKMTVKEKINAIKEYIAAEGFNYEGDLIENFYLGLKSKPFVILAGTSGTGKTKLVSLFAKAINAKLQIVPVRPDWSDSSDLFGHVDLQGNFKPGAIIDFISDASKTPDTPFILCLDEMNLARVEYYMSDILSVIETRAFDNTHKITSEKALVGENDCRGSKGINNYGEIRFPGNLYIVGTVNMDETTFPFSKKVLDRANTIEFSFVDLMKLPSFEKTQLQPLELSNSFLVSEYITMNDCDVSDSDYIGDICTKLTVINKILEKSNAHIGYRVRDEIVFYMLNNKKAGLLDEKTAFDNQIMQKILPRIHGSSESIKKMLDELLKLCESEKYDASTKKINFMIKRYEEDGFTSYWL